MTSRFRRGRDSRAGSGGPPGRGTAPLICPSCGLRNDYSARFCRNCGLPLGWPEDPVRGTTTRRADLPSERGAGVASIIGLLAAVGVLVVAGYLVLRGSGGFGTPGPVRSPTPRPSSIAVASPSGLHSASPSLGTSPLPSGSPGITDTPSQPITDPPGTFPPVTDFTCDQATIQDPTLSRWKVLHVNFSSSTTGGYDSVIMDLTRESVSSRSASISIQTVTLDEVSGTFGMNAPQNAERAVVVTFEHRLNGFTVPPSATGMKVIHNLNMDQGSDQLWHVVLGVVGNGCHRIGVDAWENDPTATAAVLTIDVKK